MMCLRLSAVVLLGAVLASGMAGLAQNGPPPGAAGGGARPPQPPPTNLKVLPKDITRADLIKLMRQYEGDLGVECEFCHAQNATTHRLEPASDANPVKDTARFMISMTDDLNKKYLDELPGRRYADPITCGTCHRGESHPSVFVPKAQPQQGGPRPGGAGPGGSPPAAPQP